MSGIGIFCATLVQVQVPAGLPVEILSRRHDARRYARRAHHRLGDIVARGLATDVEINDSSGDIASRTPPGPCASTTPGDIVIGAKSVHIHATAGRHEHERIAGDVISTRFVGDINVADVVATSNCTPTAAAVRVSGVQGTLRLP
jgi:hypothetical protein